VADFRAQRKDKEKEAQQAGLNVKLPMPKNGGLVSDKRDTYEREAMQQKEQDRMRNLQDFSYQLSEAEEKAKAEIPQSLDYYEAPPSSTISNASSQRASAMQSSTNAYQDINKQLSEWQEQPKADEKSQSALEGRMQELERKLTEAEEAKRMEDEQLAMIEKTYQLAAKYTPQTGMPDGQPAPQSASATTAGSSAGQSCKVVAQPVKTGTAKRGVAAGRSHEQRGIYFGIQPAARHGIHYRCRKRGRTE
jgi:hypothetical protein